jgi:hypothetical protein
MFSMIGAGKTWAINWQRFCVEYPYQSLVAKPGVKCSRKIDCLQPGVHKTYQWMLKMSPDILLLHGNLPNAARIAVRTQDDDGPLVLVLNALQYIQEGAKDSRMGSECMC